MKKKALAKSTVRTQMLGIRLTANERRMLDIAAAKAGKLTSVWARGVLFSRIAVALLTVVALATRAIAADGYC
jgi:hypothetical protein